MDHLYRRPFVGLGTQAGVLEVARWQGKWHVERRACRIETSDLATSAATSAPPVLVEAAEGCPRHKGEGAAVAAACEASAAHLKHRCADPDWWGGGVPRCASRTSGWCLLRPTE